MVFPKIGKIDLEIIEAKKLMDKGKVEKYRFVNGNKILLINRCRTIQSLQ